MEKKGSPKIYTIATRLPRNIFKGILVEKPISFNKDFIHGFSNFTRALGFLEINQTFRLLETKQKTELHLH
jgi:hypothetical protein